MTTQRPIHTTTKPIMKLTNKQQIAIGTARAKIISLQDQQTVVENELIREIKLLPLVMEDTIEAHQWFVWIWDFLYNTPEEEYDTIQDFCEGIEACPFECEE